MTDRAIRAPLAEDGESRTYTVKAWRVKLGDFVEEGDPVCDLSFEGSVVTVTSPARGDIQNINRVEGQQADAGYTIGFVGSRVVSGIEGKGNEAVLSQQNNPLTFSQALKNSINMNWREQLVMALVVGVTFGVVKGLYNYFTEPSFEEWLVEEMEAELERRDNDVAESDGPGSEMLNVSALNAVYNLLSYEFSTRPLFQSVYRGSFNQCISYNTAHQYHLLGFSETDGWADVVYEINWARVDWSSLVFIEGASSYMPDWQVFCFDTCLRVGVATSSNAGGASSFGRVISSDNKIRMGFRSGSINPSMVRNNLNTISEICEL